MRIPCSIRRRLGLAFIALWVCCAPAALASEPKLVQPPGIAEGAYRAQCRLMTRQISRYVDQARQALSRDNQSWAEASYQRIGHISRRRARLCPQYEKKRQGEDLVKLLRLGGKVALKMYTMGIL